MDKVCKKISCNTVSLASTHWYDSKTAKVLWLIFFIVGTVLLVMYYCLKAFNRRYCLINIVVALSNR